MKRRRKNRWHKQKTKGKNELNQTISVLVLSENGLNVPQLKGKGCQTGLKC